jgi:DNA (cytosine-5)-methyltransferase 1
MGDTMPLRFIDLFAGIGGFRLALESLGAKCVFSSEIDKYSCKTYEANFGESPDGDITEIPSKDIPEHDILCAGFPCQPFSQASVPKYKSLGRKMGFQHETQGTLFHDICRILDHSRPIAFILENVKHLKGHDGGKTWAVIEQNLENLDYTIYHKIIDARVVVPQHRERIFIVGFRDPLKFEWPEIEDKNPKLKDILEKKVDKKYTLTDGVWKALQNHSKRHNQKGHGFGYSIADLKGISRTLSARYYKDGAEILIEQKGKNPRRLTPTECRKLQGFPDDFIFPVSDVQAYRQLGNAVVVPIVKEIAKSVLASIKTPEYVPVQTKLRL